MSMGPARKPRLVALSLSVCAVAACGVATQDVKTVKGVAAQVGGGDPVPFARADAAFGLDVLNAWCRQDPAANVVLSPSSLGSGLGLVYQAARGDTAKAMARVMHLPSGDPLPGLRARNDAFRTANGKDATLHTVDQVWSDDGNPPNKDYLNRVATAYDASLKTLDIQGDPDAARDTINEAVKKATKDLVPQLLPEGTVQSDTGWVLTDAVYLKAKWASPFKKADTGEQSFTTAKGNATPAKMMKRSGSYGVARRKGWTAVDLPYVGGRLSMTALLPDDAAATGCPKLDPATLASLTGSLRPAAVDLTLPKAKLRSKADMKPLLSGLGMGVAFSGGADFTGLSPKAAELQFVWHAATLLVDEKGTEAAAATGSGMAVLAAPPPPEGKKIVFDRPYVLVVRDTKTGEPLFVARVADPTKG